MAGADIAITIAAMGGIALLTIRLARKLGWPLPTLLLIGGFAGSEALVAAGVDTGLRWYNLRELVYSVLLPLLVYETAFRLNANALLHVIGTVLLLAVPLMLLEVLIAAAMLWFGIGDAAAFPLVAALIGAALISTNDPAAVDRVLEGADASPRCRLMLEGESLFNSILALVLVSLALHVELHGARLGDGISFLEGFTYFVRLFSGGILLGFVTGLAGWLLLHHARLPMLRAVVSVLIAYGVWFLADRLANVSGVVAVLTAGLLLNAFAQRADPASRGLLRACWEHAGNLASIVLFLLLGMSVWLPLLQTQWRAAMLGIAAALLSRAVMIYGGLGLWSRMAEDAAVPPRERTPLFLGGIKGAVTVALLFSLPPDLHYGNTLQAIVYGVLLFSLLVQAPALRLLLRRPAAQGSLPSG